MIRKLNDPRGYLLALVMMTAISLLSACAQLGVTGPKTFDDKVYAAAATVDEVQKSAATLLRAKKISVADAENVLKATDAAVAGIAVARGYSATDPAAGDAKLQAVLTALTLTQTYLATKGAK